jgi:hypothetical protein
MLMQRIGAMMFLLTGAQAFAQAPSGMTQPAATMKQIMLDLIHPASNDILLLTYRGGPKDDKEWAVVRRGALALAESGNLLTMPGRARDQGEWAKSAKMLADAGTAVYKAAQAKDTSALAGLADQIDAACTACHKQYRPNVFPKDVFPREGGSK